MNNDLSPTVWRLHIRPHGQSGTENVHPDKVAEYALDRDQPFIGIGWELEKCGLGNGCSKEDAIKAAQQKYGRSPVRMFIEELQIGDYVWIRRKVNNAWKYYLYEVIGEWQYKGDEKSKELDMHHIRTVKRIGGALDHVPGPIANSFYGRSTLARIGTGRSRNAARCYTWYLCDKDRDKPFRTSISALRALHKSCKDLISNEASIGPLALLTPNELEDIVALYLQAELHYYFVPSTHRLGTYGYEYDMVKSEKGTIVKARVQVKTNMELDPANYTHEGDYVWYLFSLAGTQSDKDEGSEAVMLKPEKILAFANSNMHILPEAIQEWFDIYKLVLSQA